VCNSYLIVVQPESTKAVQCGYINLSAIDFCVDAHAYTNTQARVVVVLTFTRENVQSKVN